MNLAHNIDNTTLRPYLRPLTGQHYIFTSKDLATHVKSSYPTNFSTKAIVLENITLYYAKWHLVLY